LTAVITDPGSAASTYSVPIISEAPDHELLLVDWLDALVYEMATHVLQANRKRGEQ
jgi:tRNA nucleotidyltransferase (CCA-adding enzyme)